MTKLMLLFDHGGGGRSRGDGITATAVVVVGKEVSFGGHHSEEIDGRRGLTRVSAEELGNVVHSVESVEIVFADFIPRSPVRLRRGVRRR